MKRVILTISSPLTRNRFLASTMNSTFQLDSNGTPFEVHSNEVYNEVKNFEYVKPVYRDYLEIEIAVLYILFILGGRRIIKKFFRVAFKHGHKTGAKILFLHLIIVDLFVVVFAIFPEILWCKSISWELGQFTCKLMHTLKNFSLFASSYMIVCISFNRYYLLKEPHIFQKEKQRAYRMLRITYISSALLSIPQFIIYKVSLHPDHNYLQCVGFQFFDPKWGSRAYNFYTLVGMYIIPLKLIVFLYSRIIASLNLDKYVVARMGKSASSEERLSQKTNCMLKTKRKAIKTFLAVTIAFTICWTPYAFITLWQIFAGRDEIVNPIITSLMYMFVLLTSTVNPIVHSNHIFRLFLWCRRSGQSCSLGTRLRPLNGRSNGSDLKPINCSNCDKVNIIK